MHEWNEENAKHSISGHILWPQLTLSRQTQLDLIALWAAFIGTMSNGVCQSYSFTYCITTFTIIWAALDLGSVGTSYMTFWSASFDRPRLLLNPDMHGARIW